MYYLCRVAGSQEPSHITHNASMAWHLEKLTEGNCLVLYDSRSDLKLHRLLQAACFSKTLLIIYACKIRADMSCYPCVHSVAPAKRYYVH